MMNQLIKYSFLLFLSFSLCAAQNQGDKCIELESVQIENQERKVEAEHPAVNNQRPQIVHDEGIVVGADYDDRNIIARIPENERARHAEIDNNYAIEFFKLGVVLVVVGLCTSTYSIIACRDKGYCSSLMYAGPIIVGSALLPINTAICLWFNE